MLAAWSCKRYNRARFSSIDKGTVAEEECASVRRQGRRCWQMQWAEGKIEKSSNGIAEMYEESAETGEYRLGRT